MKYAHHIQSLNPGLKYEACSSRFLHCVYLVFGCISLQLPIHSQQIHDSSLAPTNAHHKTPWDVEILSSISNSLHVLQRIPSVINATSPINIFPRYFGAKTMWSVSNDTVCLSWRSSFRFVRWSMVHAITSLLLSMWWERCESITILDLEISVCKGYWCWYSEFL